MEKIVTLLLLIILSIGATSSIEVPLDLIKGPTCVFFDTLTNEALPFTPEHSTYNIVITDGFAELTLRQKFVNRYENKNSMTYVFPLPYKGSVNAMEMNYNGDIYTAKIYEKSEADNIFDSLKQEGKTAALLIQERPNIFVQSISNIASGDSATITVKVTLPLNFRDSIYELKIPTMVARRYTGYDKRNSIWNPADSITSTQLSINTIIQTDFLVEDITSPTHPLSISQVESKRDELDAIGILKKDEVLTQLDNRCALLLKSSAFANKDYVLRFKRRDKEVGFALATYYDKEKSQGYFAMNIYPDDTITTDTVSVDKELLILFDISGSQDGWPLIKQKEVVYSILEKLTPEDNIAVMAFNTDQTWAFEPFEIRPATSENLTQAQQFIEKQQAGGGTELYSAIDTYLQTPVTSGKERYFIFLTDGFISNEEQIFARIKSDESNPTIFTYGSGDNLNHYFLEECAKIGNGISVALTATEDAEVAVLKSWNKLVSPQIDDIAIDFGTVNTDNIICTPMNKLYKGVPITCFGTFSTGGKSTITVTGTQADKELQFEKNGEFARGGTTHRMLPQLWAKQMIEKLDMEDGISEIHRDSIIALSLEYQVLSKYTAFLAVNSGQDDGKPVSILPLSQIKKGLQISTAYNRLKLTFPKDANIKGISIVDLRGRVLFTETLSLQDVTSYSWDGRGTNGQQLSAGAYLLCIQTDKGLITTKIRWTK